MALEDSVNTLVTQTTALLNTVNVAKATLDTSVEDAGDFAQASLTSANNSAASASTATTQATDAQTARTGAETARDAAVVAQNNAVAVVTGGTATLTPEAGKIPLADGLAKIDAGWITSTALVEQSDIGTAPNEIPLNQYLGNLAFQSSESVVVGQVKFTGTGSTDPNTLDSYEEGTWTPSIGGDATYLAQTGTYTKIGNVVYVSARLHINVKGTGSGTTFSGLPFANGTQAVGVSIGKFASAANSFVSAYGEIAVSSSTGELFGMTVAGNANYVVGFFGDGTSVNFSATYTV
jgi:hypothetical protein